MKEKTSREKAKEKWRQNNKDYYSNYYKEYYKTHKRKNYNKIYKDRLNMIIEYIIDKKENSKYETIFEIAKGDYDE